MSTNNFKFENILVVLPSFNYDYKKPCKCHDDEDCEYAELDSDFDHFAYNEYVKNVQSQLEKIGFESCDGLDFNRNYGGRIIASWSIYDKNDNRKEIEVVIRSGYYDGANIDYTITEPDYVFADTKTIQKKIDSKIQHLEKILRKNGTELLKVAQFSNGEAVYKIKK